VKLVHLVGFIIKKSFPLFKYRISYCSQVFNTFTNYVCSLLPSSNLTDFALSTIDHCDVHDLYKLYIYAMKIKDSVIYSVHGTASFLKS
jgi:hypothetical protein